MRIAKWFIPALLLTGATCALAVAWERHVEEDALDAANRSALGRLDQYCWEVRLALESDVGDLESGETRRQRAATWRLQSARTLHSREDANLCAINDQHALADVDTCAQREDSVCMAKLERDAVASFPPDRRWHRVPEQGLPRLHDYCANLQSNLRSIGRQLQSEDAAAQAAAAEALLDNRNGQSEREVQLCSDDPPSYFEGEECKLDGKYHCLAALAFSASNRLYVPGETTP